MDLFNNVWEDKSEIVVDHCLDITLPVRYPLPVPMSYLNAPSRSLFSS